MRNTTHPRRARSSRPDRRRSVLASPPQPWGAIVQDRLRRLRERIGRRGAIILLAFLLVITLVPLLYGLSAADLLGPQSLLGALGGASHSSTPISPAGTPDAHALDWMSSLHDAAQVAYVNGIIARMSLDEEIGQMLITGVESTQMTPELATKIQQYHVAGVILYGNNVVSADQLRQLDHDMQAKAKIPLMIQIDQEGGSVNRLKAIDGNTPSAEQIGASNDPKVALQRGIADGQQLAGLGVNTNLAPVVDVQNLPDGQNTDGTRAYGWTPEKVSTMAGAYLQGEQQDRHVIGTLKHFPGMGSVPGDPHYSSVYLTRSLDDLERIDWAPYRTLIATGQVGMIMTTHIILTKVDPTTPTTLSYAVTTGILRQRLGFDGVIVTDDLYMEALREHYTYPQELVMAVQAGNDLISSVYTLLATEEAMQVLRDAVTSGKISKQRIDDSVRRVLLLKLRYGILPPPGGG